MKIKALANGNVIDAHPDAAKILIEAKIYERASDNEKLTSELTPPVPPPEPAKKTTPKKGSSTAVKPLGTDDMPSQPKKGKPAK